MHPDARPATCTLPPPPLGLGGATAQQYSMAVNSSRPPPHLPWASVVRGGVCASVEEPTCPSPQPGVSTADFSALYERCLESGYKARLMFSHAGGL